MFKDRYKEITDSVKAPETLIENILHEAKNMKSKILINRIFVLIVIAAVFKVYDSVPHQKETLKSPDGKIFATVYIKSGNMVIETNRSNPMTLDFYDRLDYGAASFSSDSRYLYVMPLKTENGYIECRDFKENKSFDIQVSHIIRNSEEFDKFAEDNGIEELWERSITVLGINERCIANTIFAFKDEDGKEYSVSAHIDLNNQKIETIQ